MTKDPLILRRNKVNWHYVRDDQINSAAYKEYYAITSGAAPPKTKASVRKTQSSSDTTMPPPTAAGTRLSTSAKGKQPAKSSKAKDEGTGIIPGVLDVPTDESDEEISWKSSDKDDDDDVDDQHDNDDDQDSDNDGDDFVHPKLSTHDEEAKDEESFDLIVQTPSHVEDSDDESNDDEIHGMNVGGDKGPDAEDDDEEFYRDVNINLEGRDVQITDVHTTQVLKDTHVTLTSVNPDGQQQSSSVSSQFVMSMFNPSPNAGIASIFESTPRVDVPVMTTVVLLLATAPTLPPPIMSQEQVKEQVKVQVSKILPNIKTTVNEQLEAEVLTRSSNSSNTSYTVAADLSELELKKILIKKMESNKSIYRSDEQRNLYKALVDAYAYRGSKRRREGKEPDSTSAPKEKASKTTGSADDQPIVKASQHPEWFQKQMKPPTPDRAWNKNLPANHRSIQPWISDLAKQADLCTSFNKLMDTPVDISVFMMNRLNVDTLTPELLVGLTYELMKGSCKSLFYEFVVNRESAQEVCSKCRIIAVLELQIVEWHNYKHLDWIIVRRDDDKLYKFKEGDLKRLCIQDIKDMLLLLVQGKLTNLTVEERFAFNISLRMESAQDVYSKRRIIAVLELQIVEWHNYKHLDWIIVRRDDDKLYKFKEGDLKRLCIQDIKDMLLLRVQGKLTNLTVKERFAFNISLRMFTRSIEAYTASSNPRGFIYQNKDKQNKLMRIDELHKFSDDTLIDVRTALDDRLKGIRIKYLPQIIWKRSDKERAAAMIQAIDKQLKTRRIMRSLEKLLVGDYTRDSSGCYNGPYDLSYDVFIIQRSFFTDSQVTPTKHGRMKKPYSPCFIANCFNVGYLKIKVKTQHPSLQELEMLFSLMYDKYFNGGKKSVLKSSTLSDDSPPIDTQPTLDVQPTIEPIIPPPNANAEENDNDQAENAPFEPYEFINPFAPPGLEAAKSSSRNVDPSNMHTFYHLQASEYHWTKDHPLEQVRGNPSKPVQ
nr:hypothetical protein [Tanacetum cinerariifolium]